MDGKPYKALLLELVLAGCGATLSDRALRGLAVLSKKHGIAFIVDEIMTGGRTSATKPLLLLDKSKQFLDCVSYATMGKWMGVGMVLKCKNFQSVDESQFFSSRGQSTSASCVQARLIWNLVMGRISLIPQRRQQVIRSKKYVPSECWGEGLLIFGPFRRNDAIGALKNRFLPMLEPGLKPDSMPLTKYEKGWDIASLDKIIRKRVLLWKDASYSISSAQQHVDRGFCDWVLKNKRSSPIQFEEVKHLKSTVDVYGDGKKKVEVSHEVSQVLKRAKSAGLVTNKMVSSKRQRRWFPSSVLEFEKDNYAKECFIDDDVCSYSTDGML